jgi:hypothetical protein
MDCNDPASLLTNGQDSMRYTKASNTQGLPDVFSFSSHDVDRSHLCLEACAGSVYPGCCFVPHPICSC